MTKILWIRLLFGIASAYDLVLGLVFLIAPAWMFEVAGVTEPNHWGYVHFPAALLIVFGLMFAAIARSPKDNRRLIPYGIGLKLAYCTVVFGHWMTQGIPDMWKPFAVIDLVMAILFAWAFIALGAPSMEGRPVPDGQ